MTTLERVLCWPVRHPGRALLAVGLLAVAGALAALVLVTGSTEQNRYPGLPAWEANEAVRAAVGNGGYQRPWVAVVDLPGAAPVTDPGPVAALRAGAAALAAQTGARVLTPADVVGAADPFRGPDPSLSYLLVLPAAADEGGMPGAALGEGSDHTAAIERALAAALPPGSTVGVTGLDALSASVDEGGLDVGLKVGTAALLALVVLGWVFRSALALLPLLTAVLAMPLAALMLLPAGLLAPMHETTFAMVPLLAIGVAVDYALLIVLRWREERAALPDPVAAVRAAVTTAGRTVAVSGLAIAAALGTLVTLPVPLLRSLGLGGAATVLAAALASLAVVPAVLVLVGPRMRIRPAPAVAPERTFWGRWAGWAVRHRVAVAAGAVLLLGGLTAIGTGAVLTTPESGRLATSGPAAAVLDMLRDGGLPVGALSAFDVLTTRSAAPAVTAALESVPGVAGVAGPAVRGDAVVLTVVPRDESGTAAGEQTLAAVRAALAGTAMVGGNAAQQLDYVEHTYPRASAALALVVVVLGVIVAAAFRSVVLAAKAMLLALLSLGAVIGALVLVWQHGWGSGLLGVPADGTLGTFVPVTVFCFLLGLTTDYEMFLLARIREEHEAGADTETAVVRAVGRTGRLLSAAATILFCSFLAMALTRELDVAVFASGVALGIALDAVLVRGLLVPALVALLGPANWWRPRPRRPVAPGRRTVAGVGIGPG